MRVSRRWTSVFATALIVMLLSGCVERESSNHQTTYHFAWWTGPLIIWIGLLGIGLSLLMLRLRKELRIPMMGMVAIMPLILLLIVAPSMYSDRVIIDDDHFEARYGFWFTPSDQKIWFKH